MPVAGLPAAVEMSLNALLSVSTISSWKLVGEGDNTVFVLRMKPAQSSTTTNMANHEQTTTAVHYRRKPPSQVRRDQERARQRQQTTITPSMNKASETTENHKLTLFEDEDNCVSEAESIGLFDISTAAMQTTAAANMKITDGNHVSAMHDLYQAPVGGVTVACTESFNEVSSPGFYPCQPEDPSLTIAIKSGFDPNIIMNYVGTLTDRGVQRLLRTDSRNQVIKKVVRVRKDLRELLLFESDDLVLELDITMARNALTFWFVKQPSMLEEEDERINTLRTGRNVDDSRFLQARACAQEKLHILRDVITYYLG